MFKQMQPDTGFWILDTGFPEQYIGIFDWILDAEIYKLKH
jgi:hypothetical protein